MIAMIKKKEIRSKIVNLRFTPSEHAILAQNAKNYEVTMAELIRSLVLTQIGCCHENKSQV